MTNMGNFREFHPPSAIGNLQPLHTFKLSGCPKLCGFHEALSRLSDLQVGFAVRFDSHCPRASTSNARGKAREIAAFSMH